MRGMGDGEMEYQARRVLSQTLSWF